MLFYYGIKYQEVAETDNCQNFEVVISTNDISRYLQQL